MAKAAAHWEVANYRDAYGLYACTGVLFNHESPLRPERFVTKKIVATACRIAKGAPETLKLGNIDVVRDWGWAPEYVDAMWRMLQQESPADYVIATGESHSLREFVAAVFHAVDLDWRDHVATDAALLRPSDLSEGRANPRRAEDMLRWRASRRLSEVVSLLVQYEKEKPGYSSVAAK